MLSNEELIKIGVNPNNLVYPDGEMNVIVQCFGLSDDDIQEIENNDSLYEVQPDVYHPRKNSVWSCAQHGDGYDLSDEDDKKDYVMHLRDSAERLKIMAYYLTKQAEEIEEFGYPKTTLYYPE